MTTKTASEIVIYEGDNARVEVRLDRESVWLTQEQVGLLFGRERSVITKHIRNVFAEGELERAAVCANFAHTAADGKTYQVDHYNLDVIISVGYRVKSIQGTRFRQWATRVLREHLTQGFSLDRERFEKNATELEAALQLVRKAAAGEALTADQGRGLVDVIARYTHTFLWLQRYDEGLLTVPTGSPGGVLPTLEEAHAAIARLKTDLVARGEASDLFGQDRGDAFLAMLRAPGPPPGALAALPCPPICVTWSSRCSASRPIPPSKPRPRTCCISSSRTIRFRTVTSDPGPSCSWIFWRATGGWSVMVSR